MAMSRRKDISNDLGEAIVVALQSGRDYKVVSDLFGVHHSTERKIIHKWKEFKTAVNLPRNGRPRKFTSRSNFTMLRETAKKPKSYISDSTGLS